MRANEFQPVPYRRVLAAESEILEYRTPSRAMRRFMLAFGAAASAVSAGCVHALMSGAHWHDRMGNRSESWEMTLLAILTGATGIISLTVAASAQAVRFDVASRYVIVRRTLLGRQRSEHGFFLNEFCELHIARVRIKSGYLYRLELRSVGLHLELGDFRSRPAAERAAKELMLRTGLPLREDTES